MKSVQTVCFGAGHGRVVAKCLVAAAVIFSLAVTVPANADVVTLYDGTDQAVTPDNYDPTWLTYQSFEGLALGPGQNYDAGKKATHVNSAGAVPLKPQVGYSNYSLVGSIINPAFPVLDRQTGYKIGFTLEILSESRDDGDRAGFSIIAVSSDVADGVSSSVEIGFQDGRVFSHNNDFNGFDKENTSFDPVGPGFIDYELSVSADSYDLTADGSSILTGELHDHFGQVAPPFGLPSPYEIPSLIFLGDDTTSAVADFNLRSVSVTTVPEPSSLALMGLGVLGAMAYGVRRRRG